MQYRGDLINTAVAVDQILADFDRGVTQTDTFGVEFDREIKRRLS